MARSTAPAVLALVSPQAEFRTGLRPDPRLKPRRAVVVTLGVFAVLWAVVANTVLF